MKYKKRAGFPSTTHQRGLISINNFYFNLHLTLQIRLPIFEYNTSQWRTSTSPLVSTSSEAIQDTN